MAIQPKRKKRPSSNQNSKSSEGETLPANALKKLPAATPRFVEPMKALTKAELPGEPGWSFELKLDGIRAIAYRDGATLRIFSRRPRDLTAEYPEIVAALRKLPGTKWIMDGEIVALDERGHTSFQLLQNRQRTDRTSLPILLYAFDLLNLNGRDLQSLPLQQRRALLRNFLPDASDLLRFSASLDAPAATVWREVTRHRLEGVMAKRSDSVYESGRRSGAWLKIKSLREQEFVIGGYYPPGGSRKFFGSIIVGYYEGNQLMFASKVGTGFDHATLKSLFTLFQKYRLEKCPFANLPVKRRGRFGQSLTASEMRKCTWIKPELVCQVRFLEWTDDNNLRQPVFLGLRDDRRAREVVREETAR